MVRALRNTDHVFYFFGVLHVTRFLLSHVDRFLATNSVYHTGHDLHKNYFFIYFSVYINSLNPKTYKATLEAAVSATSIISRKPSCRSAALSASPV